MKPIALGFVLLALASCGDDTGDATPDSSVPTPVAVTLTASSIDGLPDDLSAGVVDVTVTDETAADVEINFSRVEPGTDEEAFVDGLLPVFDGGPFPDFLLNTVGLSDSGKVALDEGDYIAWIDLKLGSDELSTAEDIITAPMSVAAGEDNAEISGTDGTVTATDYHFGIDVEPGASTLTFNNDSDTQFHHVVLVDFGTNDLDLVTSKLPEMLTSAPDAPPPNGLDVSQVNFEFASTSVYGPGASGTFDAPLEAGHTYAALCFIADRAGGAPHAMQHDMYEVFQV